MIVGIHGLARAGKTTLAEMLENKSTLETYPLAKPIKDIMCALFGWDERHREGELKEELIRVRVTNDDLSRMKQAWNQYKNLFMLDFDRQFTEIVRSLAIKDMEYGNPLSMDDYLFTGVTTPRNVFQRFGTEWGRNKIDGDIWLKLAPNNCILPDVRFENEAEYVRENGTLIFLNKNDRDEIDNSNVGHESEKGLTMEKGDYLIVNNGTLDDLNNEASKFLQNQGVV